MGENGRWVAVHGVQVSWGHGLESGLDNRLTACRARCHHSPPVNRCVASPHVLRPALPHMRTPVQGRRRPSPCSGWCRRRARCWAGRLGRRAPDAAAGRAAGSPVCFARVTGKRNVLRRFWVCVRMDVWMPGRQTSKTRIVLGPVPIPSDILHACRILKPAFASSSRSLLTPRPCPLSLTCQDRPSALHSSTHPSDSTIETL